MTAPAMRIDSAQRRRALALMQVDVYALRRSNAAIARAQIEAPAAAVREATLTDAYRAVAPARCTIAYDPLDAGAEPLHGRYAGLLAQVVQALGLGTADLHWQAGGVYPTDTEVLCFGVAPGLEASTVLAAPLATVRASSAAKRALWNSLKPLIGRLRG